MSFFNLDLLLHSNNFQVITSHSRTEEFSCRNETLIWEDNFGPLKIYRVTSGSLSFHRLRLGDEIAVDVMPEGRLAIHPRRDVPKITIDHFLADQVFPRAISQVGEFVLHSGAIRNDGHAILLLGSSGRGKSTLVTSFHRAGWDLMGDDAMVISWVGGIPSACAIYPSLRLFPDSIKALVSELVATETIAHYSSKQRLDVSISGEGVSQPCPVSAIFLLAEPSVDGQIHVRRLSIADACISCLENSFALDPSDAERARQRLEWASTLARQVPAFAISYPHDYARLADVRETILKAVADCPELRHREPR